MRKTRPNSLLALAAMVLVVLVLVPAEVGEALRQNPVATAIYAVLFGVLAYVMTRPEKPLNQFAPHETDPLLLSPIEYEEHCADILRRSGWAAIDTPTSGDQGADIVATLRGIKAVIQCKRYGGAVGNAAVQQAVAAKAYYGAQVAVVVCPRGYTASAKALALKNRALLLSHADLPRLEQLARIP